MFYLLIVNKYINNLFVQEANDLINSEKQSKFCVFWIIDELKNDSFLLHFRSRWCHHCHDYQAFGICRQILEFVVYNQWWTDWNGEKDNQNQLFWQVSVWIAVFCDWLTYFAPWSKIIPAKLVVTSVRALCARTFSRAAFESSSRIYFELELHYTRS